MHNIYIMFYYVRLKAQYKQPANQELWHHLSK